MPKPHGAMGSPNWVGETSITEYSTPAKYSHLPASEARAKVAQENEIARIAEMEAEVQRRVKEQTAKPQVKAQDSQPVQKPEICEGAVLGGNKSSNSLSSQDIIDLLSNAVIHQLTITSVSNTGICFTLGASGKTYRITN